MYYKKMCGEKIYLSPLNIEDYEKYTKWINDSSVAKNINQLHNITTEDNEKKWIERAYQNYRYQFAIVEEKKNIPLGICGLELINNISKRYHIVCFIGDDDNRNKGYGTEAIKLTLKFAFEVLNAHTVFSTIYEFNEASLAVTKKLGFKNVGKFRESIYQNLKYYDEVIIEMTKNDYINFLKEQKND